MAARELAQRLSGGDEILRLHAHVLAGNQGPLRFLQQLGFRSVGREGPLVVLELAD